MVYDPSIGRWTEKDPIGFTAGDMNLYSFVGNGPTDATDPTGKQAFALGDAAKEYILDELYDTGVNAYEVPLGPYPFPAGGKRNLFLILPSKDRIDPTKDSTPLTQKLANVTFGPINKNQTLFYQDMKGEYVDQSLDVDKLTTDQKIAIFEANLVANPKTATGSIGYDEFKQQGWKKVGLGAVFTEVALKYGEEGVKLLNVAIKANFPINSDGNGNWLYEKEFKVGQIVLAETKGVGPLSRPTTVSEAAGYLFDLLKEHEQDIKDWSNSYRQDPSSAAQIDKREYGLYNHGRGLAEGFDQMLSEAIEQTRGLMWQYALVGLNVRVSAVARAATSEREIQMWSSSARQAAQRKNGNSVASTAGKAVIAGKGPTLKWRINPDGAKRTIQQAVEIAKKHGIEIPADVQFWENPYLTGDLENMFAETGNITGKVSATLTNENHYIYWKDLYTAKGKISVEINSTVLTSDEAIVAVFGHELHEIQSLRVMFAENKNRMPYFDFLAHVSSEVSGNLHHDAWDVADALVKRMRGE